LFEEGALEFQNLFDAADETAGPCREIKMDREHGRLVLLVDRRELMGQTLDKLGIQSLSPWQADLMLSLWRTGRMEELRKHLKLPPST